MQLNDHDITQLRGVMAGLHKAAKALMRTRPDESALYYQDAVFLEKLIHKCEAQKIADMNIKTTIIT